MLEKWGLQCLWLLHLNNNIKWKWNALDSQKSIYGFGEIIRESYELWVGYKYENLLDFDLILLMFLL